MNVNPNITGSSIYRTLCRNGINKVSQKEREKAKKFKEYEPGFLHIDVTYLPKFDRQKNYLFVAIDRAARTLFFKVYDAKTSENAKIFMDECLAFFPFEITHVLTDNGLEFTNRLIKSKKEIFVKNPLSLMKSVKKTILNIGLQNPIRLKQKVGLKESTERLKTAPF